MTNVINSLKDYTTWGKAYQLSLPFNYEVQFSANDPVRLVRSFIARMDLSSLYKNCRHINKNQATPAQMLAILVYAYYNKIFSTRGIEEACHSNIKFMYLLEGNTAQTTGFQGFLRIVVPGREASALCRRTHPLNCYTAN